jgi:hypothetical protein
LLDFATLDFNGLVGTALLGPTPGIGVNVHLGDFSRYTKERK